MVSGQDSKKLDILQTYDNPGAMWFSKLGLGIRLWMTGATLVMGGALAWRASIAGISERTATRGSLWMNREMRQGSGGGSV